jgi:hypothetical protein
MSAEISMQLSPRWEEVARVRRNTTTFLKDLSVPRDVVEAVSMVACELTENATKYGAQARTPQEAKIDVRVAVAGGQVTVEVSNPIHPTDRANLTRLDRMVQWIRGYQDPFEAYLQRLREISGDGLESHESRLGLVRIAYEGQSVLDFYVDENDVLAVSAMRRL